jgi:hypothetical protein
MDADADYPAAHSMDTTWFAVDREGLVACFDTGENGAMPASAYHEEGFGGAMLDRLQAVVPGTEPIFELRGRYGIHQDWAVHTRPIPDEMTPMPGWDRSVLMFVRSLGDIREEIDSGAAIPVASEDVPAVVFPVLRESLSDRLHAAEVCLGCFDNDPSTYSRPERLGLFHYGNPDDLPGAEPYGRIAKPRVPIHVDQLPDHLRDALMGVQFPSLSFEDTPRIQPVELIPCRSWGAAYLTLDGTAVQPIPGKEEEYRREYWGPSDDPRYIIEPPTEA